MKSGTSEAPPSYSTTIAFPHHDRKYLYCGIHVLTGAKMLAFLLVIFHVFDLHDAVLSPKEDVITTWNRIIVGPQILCLLLLFIGGLYHKRSGDMTPYIAVICIQMFFWITIVFLCIFSKFYPNGSIAGIMKESFEPKSLVYSNFLFGAMRATIKLWALRLQLSVFDACSDYLRDLKLHKRIHRHPVANV